MSDQVKQDKRIAEEIIRLRIGQMIVNEEQKAKRLKVGVHLAMGHEAIAVAVSEIMREGDYLLPTHRNIAYNLVRAGAVRPILEEYRLSREGLNQGRSGSMNMLNPERGIIYTSSILGNQLAVAPGLAMSLKMDNNKNVVIALAGDGSIEEGSFYESMLMAQSLKVPVMYLIEDNEWSLGTHVKERRCPIDTESLARSLGIRYLNLKGNDPYAYIEALREIRDYAVLTSSPVCVEVRVYTLGDWRLKTPEHPEGEIINYHAGPAPEVSLSEWPIIRDNDEDPIHVLTKYFYSTMLAEVAREQFATLQKEVA